MGNLETYLLSCIRSKDEWLVEQEGDIALMKASMGADPILPPTYGWKFYNWETEKFEKDPSLKLKPPVASSPRCLTVTLTGPAKEAHGNCEGKYKSTGLISVGRQVMSMFALICHHSH